MAKTHISKCCTYCGVAFTAPPSKSAAKYCSKPCHWAATAKKTYACVVCGSVKLLGTSKEAKYCSLACFYIARTNKTPIICGVCDITFYVKVSHSAKRKFCSKTCHDTHQSRNKRTCTCFHCGVGFERSQSLVMQSGITYCSIVCRDKDTAHLSAVSVKANTALQALKGGSSLEKVGYALLDALGVTYVRQFSVANKFVVDAYIPTSNLVIQWDGDYWHGYRAEGDNTPVDVRVKKRMNLDVSQDAYMKTCGYTVARFWGHDVLSSPKEVLKRISTLLNRC